MDASIVVCTYNRAESLKDTLAALARLGAPPTRTWEVVVVDNNSRDRTAEEARMTTARVVRETAQGYGHALRRGLREATGDLIIMAEKVVLPEPPFPLTAMVIAMSQNPNKS